MQDVGGEVLPACVENLDGDTLTWQKTPWRTGDDFSLRDDRWPWSATNAAIHHQNLHVIHAQRPVTARARSSSGRVDAPRLAPSAALLAPDLRWGA